MADHIVVSTNRLEQLARELRTTQDSVSQAASVLSGVNTSRVAGGQVHVNIQGIPGGTVAEVVQSQVKALRKSADEIGKTAANVSQAAQMFDNAEKTIVNQIEMIAVSAGGSTSSAGAANNGSSQNQNTPAQTREEYYRGCEDRREHAIDEEVARLYDKFKNRMHIGSDTSSSAYYNPLWNKIFFNWKDDASNPRGAYTTYFHETGHMIDDYTKWWGDSSSSKSFTNALQNDFDNYVAKVMKENSCDRNAAYEIISDWLWEDSDNKNGISDLCGGLTGNECVGRWLHDDSYWSGKTEHGVPDKVNNEAFAHFFEASMSTDSTKLDYIKEIFPNAYDEFKNIVRDNL